MSVLKSSFFNAIVAYVRWHFFVLSSLSEKKFVLNAEEKLMQPKTSQKFKNVACFRLLFKIKQPKRLQSTKSVAINTWFLLIKPNFNVKMQRYETNHRKRVVEENLNQVWSNKFLPKTYSPSFWGCHKSTENFVTHGFWVRRYVALVVSVPIPLRTQWVKTPMRRKIFCSFRPPQNTATSKSPSLSVSHNTNHFPLP